MENNTNENLSFLNYQKPKILKNKEKYKEKDKSNPIYQSINSTMLKNIGIILSPSSFLSRNNDKNISSTKKNIQEKKINKNLTKIKLIKNIKGNNAILPNIKTEHNISPKNTLLHSIKSTKIVSNKLFKNNFLINKKTINPIKQKSKDERNLKKISTAFLLSRSTNLTDIYTKNKEEYENINRNNITHKSNKKIKIRGDDSNQYNYTYNNFYKIIKDKIFYSPQKQIIKNNCIDKNNTPADNFLNSKNDVFNLSNFNLKLLCKNMEIIKPIYKKENKKEIVSKFKNSNFFSELKKENDLMKQEIKKDYNLFNELKKKYYLKNPNENTYEGFSKIFYKYNKDRSKKNNIYTNRIITLNWAGDKNLQNIDYKEKEEKREKTKLNNVFFNSKGRQILYDDKKYKNKNLDHQELSNLCFIANQQVEKIFPDMLAFNLPKIFHDNKTYTIKLLYDVFIEFKTLLKFCILFNKDINIHNKGIDFPTFFNCNTKINEQGEGLSKKIFKTLNNKIEKEYMPWGNYIDGMMRMKDPDMNNKMDFFFQILDENGDGSLDYNEVYNLSLVSLQRTLSQNPLDILKKSEKEKKNQKEVIGILAEFFSNMIFDLVNIDIKNEIPIEILRQKMQEGGEASEYLEMFLCADNFA